MRDETAPRRLRHRVVLRPKQRSRRNRIAVAVVAVAALSWGAFFTVRQLSREIGSPQAYIKSVLLPSLVAVELTGGPQSVREEAAEFLAERRGATAAAQAAALREEFPCLKSVTIRRSWLRRTVRLELALRAAVARAAGKRSAYLSDDGVVFEAPEDLYGVTSPVVEPGAAGPKELEAAAALVLAARAPGAAPSPLASLRWTSAAEGWEARLEDGTVVLWGEARWTSDKLARLREVVADARARNEPTAPFVADLRYFEDGKVLLRPLASRGVPMRGAR